MTTERDPIDALEDILQNMEMARSFLGESSTVDELEADPKTLYSVARALEVVGEATKRPLRGDCLHGSSRLDLRSLCQSRSRGSPVEPLQLDDGLGSVRGNCSLPE